MLYLLRATLPATGLSLLAILGFAFSAQAAPASADPADPVAAALGFTAQAGGNTAGAGDGASGDADKEDGEKKDDKTLEEMVKDHEKIDGLFTLYRDTESGKLFMEISQDQLGPEFIYFSHSLNGTPFGGFGTIKGGYRGEAVFTIQRHFKKLEFVFENTFFHFDDESALKKAKDSNISRGLAYSGEIKAKSEDGTRYLIEADPLFVSETLTRIKQPRMPDTPPFVFGLGKFNKAKSKISNIGSYEKNLDIAVDYTFDNPNVMSWPSLSISDPRYVTATIQHSFIAMPEEPFEPRFADQRVGYFTHRVTDLTSYDVTPYRDLVNRWRLEKKDPDAEISDPIKPITFWMEDSTPVEWRDTIRAAALRWNEAFETAGISNAIEVKQQGPIEDGFDGECPAERIDCHVLRWTSSPVPVFGGYGPSFYNPRTGEILGADIMLELVWITNRLRADELYTPLTDGSMQAFLESDPMIEKAVEIAGLPGGPEQLAAMVREGAFDQDEETGMRRKAFAQHPMAASGYGHQHCAHSQLRRMNMLMAMQTLEARGASEDEKSRLIEESIYELVLHEIGHTLGLSHNMKATNLHPFEIIHNRAATGDILTASVMDYAPVNIAPKGAEQGQYYTTRPGPYDKWAIEFGYRPDLDDEAREALLARSTEPALAFGNDADDMRAAGGWGIDPRVMIGDMSADAIGYSIQRIGLAKDTLGDIQQKFTKDGESWHALATANLILALEKANAAGIIARYVGGVQVERFVAGQAGSEDLKPFTPVDAATQKRAVAALREHILAPGAFEIPGDLAQYLQYERRGFDFFGITEDPKLHEIALAIQGSALAHIMSPVVLRRVTNSRLYGNEYTSYDFLSELTKAVFEDDAQANVNTYRQNLQLQYVARLIVIVYLPFFDDVTQSAALANLRDIRQMIAPRLFPFGGPSLDLETQAHHKHVQLMLRAVGIF